MYSWISDGRKEMSTVYAYHFLNKPPVKRESSNHVWTNEQRNKMIGTASTNTPTHSDLLLNMNQSIYTGRLRWNLQINHLERKMIFQTSMIMFHVNLQGCNTNVFWWSPFPKLESRHLPKFTNGDRIDIGSIAAEIVGVCVFLEGRVTWMLGW